VKIEVGDKVLVKRLAFDGKHKIQDKFEVYTVTEQRRPDILVFTVRAPSGSGLHRNHLLLINNPDDASEEHSNPVDEQEKEIIEETDPDKDASEENEEVDVNKE